MESIVLPISNHKLTIVAIGYGEDTRIPSIEDMEVVRGWFLEARKLGDLTKVPFGYALKVDVYDHRPNGNYLLCVEQEYPWFADDILSFRELMLEQDEDFVLFLGSHITAKRISADPV